MAIETAPFREISVSLLNDGTDSSGIELDGVTFCSCNEWDASVDGTVPLAVQTAIHDTLSRVASILEDYRDGKLVRKVRNSAAPMYHNLSDDELFREARRMHDVPIIEELIKRIEGLQTRIYDLETLTNEEEGNVT